MPAPRFGGDGNLADSEWQDQVDFGNAKMELTRLAGWIDGLIEEARMSAEAEAYAEARVKAERGIGFKP